MLQRFLALPAALHNGGNDGYIPVGDPTRYLISSGSPFLRYGRFRHFMVLSDGEVCGRATASCTCTGSEQGRGSLGFLDFSNDPAVLRVLLDEALAWLTGQGIRTVTGPVDLNTWHRYRFVTEPGERPAFLREPWNPSWYPKLFEEYGFLRRWGYFSSLDDNLPSLAAGFRTDHEHYLESGYSFRRFNPLRYSRDIRILQGLASLAFRNNPGYTEIPSDEFRSLYGGRPFLLGRSLILFALDRAGRETGFAFAVPDYSENFRAASGALHIGAPAAFLGAGLKKSRWIFKTMGRVPGPQPVRIGRALTCELMDRIMSCGGTEVLLALMRVGSSSEGLFTAARRIRGYTLYELPI